MALRTFPISHSINWIETNYFDQAQSVSFPLDYLRSCLFVRKWIQSVRKRRRAMDLSIKYEIINFENVRVGGLNVNVLCAIERN